MSGGPSPRPLRVALLAVGDELLCGEIADTNSAWLARRLREHGHVLSRFTLVGDELPAIRQAVERAGDSAELLIVTGGLGPTRDDITRDGVAAAFGLPLVERPELLASLSAHYARHGLPVSADSARQAALPAGAVVLENARGTAPGFLLRRREHEALGGLTVACLPGVPGEMRAMADALLAEHVPAGPAHGSRRLLACGLAESAAGDRLADLMDHARGERTDCRLGITVKAGVLSITLRGHDEAAIAALASTVRERLGAAVFGEGDDTLAGAVVARLAERRLTVTTAESCTGGLLAGALTSVPGSSAVFREGVIAYADDAKRSRLGVPEALIAAHGVVSEPVAIAMAEGQRARAGADVALAISGIAGPDGGTPGKPVGTVALALADARGSLAVARHWMGARDEVRQRSVTAALDLLRRRLLEAEG